MITPGSTIVKESGQVGQDRSIIHRWMERLATAGARRAFEGSHPGGMLRTGRVRLIEGVVIHYASLLHPPLSLSGRWGICRVWVS